VGRPEIGRPATGPRAHAGGVAAGVCAHRWQAVGTPRNSYQSASC
jgi:hypothetical protein